MKKILNLLLLFQFVFLVIGGSDFYMNSDIESVMRVLIATLMIIDGLLYLTSIFIIKIKSVSIDIIFTAFIISNILLTFTDEVGLWDYIILVANIIILSIYFIFKRVVKTEKV